MKPFIFRDFLCTVSGIPLLFSTTYMIYNLNRDIYVPPLSNNPGFYSLLLRLLAFDASLVIGFGWYPTLPWMRFSKGRFGVGFLLVRGGGAGGRTLSGSSSTVSGFELTGGGFDMYDATRTPLLFPPSDITL